MFCVHCGAGGAVKFCAQCGKAQAVDSDDPQRESLETPAPVELPRLSRSPRLSHYRCLGPRRSTMQMFSNKVSRASGLLQRVDPHRTVSTEKTCLPSSTQFRPSACRGASSPVPSFPSLTNSGFIPASSRRDCLKRRRAAFYWQHSVRLASRSLTVKDVHQGEQRMFDRCRHSAWNHH